MPRLTVRNIFVGILTAVALAAVVVSFLDSSPDRDDVPLSDVIASAKAGQVEEIQVRGDRLVVTMADGEDVESRKEEDVSIFDTLAEAGIAVGPPDGITVEVKQGERFSGPLGLLIEFLPLVIFAVILFSFMLWGFSRRRSRE
jgi:ATP-dependent Zn protease